MPWYWSSVGFFWNPKIEDKIILDLQSQCNHFWLPGDSVSQIGSRHGENLMNLHGIVRTQHSREGNVFFQWAYGIHTRLFSLYNTTILGRFKIRRLIVRFRKVLKYRDLYLE